MINKKIKSALELYEVDLPDKEIIESVILDVTNSKRIVKTPEISFKRILLSQISLIKNSFWLISLLFLIVVLFLYLRNDSEYTTLFLFSTTPFLNVVALPILFFTYDRERMELEGSCLIKPATIFSAKTVICGAFDLMLIAFAVLISALFTDIPVLQSAFLGLVGFTSSAFIALCFSLFFKTQVAMAVTSAIYAVVVSCVYVFDDVTNFVLNLNSTVVLITVGIFSLLLAGIFNLTLKNYKFERVVLIYGTENF